MDFEKEKVEEYSVFVALCRQPGSDEVNCSPKLRRGLPGSSACLTSQRSADSL